MTHYPKEITNLTQAFMSRIANKRENFGRIKADMMESRVTEYLWPHERMELFTLGTEGMEAVDKGESREDVAEYASARQAEIYAAVALRNGFGFQASRMVDLGQTDENSVNALKKVKLKKFAAVVAKARTEKGLAV